MSAPELSATASTYKVTWPDNPIELRFDHVRDSNGTLNAEVCAGVRQKDKEQPPKHLYMARFNLLAQRAKEDYARMLAKCAPLAECDWHSLVEAATMKVILKHREGEPFETIGDLPRSLGVQWLLEPFLIKGEPNLAFGDGGNGKSTLAVMLAALVQNGAKRLNLNPSTNHNVLYVDYETSRQEINDRYLSLCAGLSIREPSLFFYRRFHQPFIDEVDTIQRFIQDNDVGLIIIDSVRGALGSRSFGDASDSGVDYFMALRSLNLTSLSIDHVSKGPPGSNPSPYGTVYKKNICRNLWEVKAASPGSNPLVSGLFHRKINNDSLRSPIGFEFTFTGPNNNSTTVSLPPFSTTVSLVSVFDSPSLDSAASLPQRLKAILLHDQLSTQQLADATGADLNVVRNALSRRSKSGWSPFQSLSNGFWGLASFPSQDP